jgi:RecA-family ATPase
MRDPRDSISLDQARADATKGRKPFIDSRIRSEPKPHFAAGLPAILDGDVARWIGRHPAPIPFVIEDFIPRDMTTLLVAHGGVGKSQLSQTAMTAVAAGIQLFGKGVEAGCSAAVFAEDPDEILHVRQDRINEALGTSLEQLAGRMYPVSYSGVDAVLWRGGKTTRFFDDLECQLREIPNLRLLAVDNVALVYADNENDRIAVSGFLNALNGMASRLRCGILLSTHTSKSTDGESNRIASGSTAWLNACRSVLQLTRDADDDDRVTLKIAKANHTRPGSKINLRWVGGVLLAEERDGGFFGAAARRNIQEVFLVCLDSATEQQRITTTTKGSTYAPKLFASMPQAKGCKPRDLEMAMEELLAAGRIKNGVVGKYANRTPRMGLVRSELEGVGDE